MPIYAYTCDACGGDVELLQKVGARAPGQCPQCGASGTLRKQLTAAGFRLKGAGWYETDFKGSGRRNVAGDKQDAGADKGASKGDGKGDGKGKGDAAPAKSAGKTGSAPAKSAGAE